MKLAPIIITFIGLASLMMQWSKHRDLERQINKAPSQEFSTSQPNVRLQVTETPQSPKTSMLRDKLERFIATDESDTSNLNTIVALLSNATAEDIFPLIKEYRDETRTAIEEDRDDLSKIGNVYYVLGVFHAELAPLKTLIAGNYLNAFKREAFTALAVRLPDKAMDWLEASDLSPKERERYLESHYKNQILENSSEHLDAWRLHHSFDTCPVPLLEPSLITDLLPKITDPENADIRLRVGASEDFACRETLDWAIDLGGETPEKAIDLSEGFMAIFAQRDLNAAADWLDDFQGHPTVKDQLTARYAMVLGATDPEAAQPWIAKIQDEKERNSVLRETLHQWEKEDPKGFVRWQKR